MDTITVYVFVMLLQGLNGPFWYEINPVQTYDECMSERRAWLESSHATAVSTCRKKEIKDAGLSV